MAKTHFDADLLKDLREQTLRFVKLDFGYVAVIGVAITTLKASAEDLVSYVGANRHAATALVVLILFDAVADRLVFSNWLAARNDDRHPWPNWVLRTVLAAQYWLHAVFIIFMISGTASYLTGMHEACVSMEGRVLIQEEVERYIREAGKAPKSQNELPANSPSMLRAIRHLDGEEFLVESTTPSQYKIIFGGWDKVLRTADDEVVTAKDHLRDIYERVCVDKHHKVSK